MVLKDTLRRRLTRAEKVEDTKNRLLAAGIEVVGKMGYSESSIALITQHAKVAQGTFYNYFESRQDLLDQLLPHLGNKLLEFIRERLIDVGEGFERERVGFVAFFEFVAQHPAFFRIFHEAEIFAPTGYQSHMDNMARGYMRSLSRNLQQGVISGYTERELELVTFILLAARDFVAKRYTQSTGSIAVPPTWVVDAYMKFLRSGLNNRPPEGEGEVSTSGPVQSGMGLTYEPKGELHVVARAVLAASDCIHVGATLAKIGEGAAFYALDRTRRTKSILVSSSFSRARRIEPGEIAVDVHGSVGDEGRAVFSLTYKQWETVVAFGTIIFGAA